MWKRKNTLYAAHHKSQYEKNICDQNILHHCIHSNGSPAEIGVKFSRHACPENIRYVTRKAVDLSQAPRKQYPPLKKKAISRVQWFELLTVIVCHYSLVVEVAHPFLVGVRIILSLMKCSRDSALVCFK